MDLSVARKKFVMIFVVVFLLAPTLGTVIESLSNRYLVCSSPQHGGASEVFETTIAAKSQALETCDATSQRVIVKCSKIGPLPLFEAEFNYMNTLNSSGFTPKPFEFFNKDGDASKPCMSMEMLGLNLESLRLHRPGIWPSVTLGSIGVKLLTIGNVLHNTYRLLHRDLHAGNVCLERDTELSRNLFLIDLGDMTPMQSDERASEQSYRLDEVRQMVLTIRFLLDGDLKYYVTKRYTYDEDEICQGAVPLPLCEALRYVFGLKEDSPSIDDEFLIRKMNDLTNNTFSGGVIWDPYIEVMGMPDLNKPLELQPFVAERAHSPTPIVEDKSPIATNAHSSSRSDVSQYVAPKNSSTTKAAAALKRPGPVLATLLFVPILLVL